MPVKGLRGDLDTELSTLADCTHSGLARLARMREVAASRRSSESSDKLRFMASWTTHRLYEE